MKKRLWMIGIFIILLRINVLADLNDKQAHEIAVFTRNFVNKGLSQEHIDSKGMPIFVYGQGPGRVNGYQEKLSFVEQDYRKKININSNKWVFDCASFTSYIYKKTLNISLLDSNYLGGNPYMVSNYESDRVHFTSIGIADSNTKGMTGQELLKIKNLLKEGDLIVVVSHHIAIYIGNNELAEATPGYSGAYVNDNTIYKGEGLYNLGIGITNLDFFINQNMVKENTFMVLRLKDGIIGQDSMPNTTIVWPDTLKPEDLGDISHDSKTIINAKLSETDFVKKLYIKVDIKNDNGIKEISVGKNSTPNFQNINNLKEYHTEYEVSNNGTYYIYVKDNNDNVSQKMIDVTNIDNNNPSIIDIQFTGNRLVVIASDNETYSNNLDYSFNNNIFTKDNIFMVEKNGTYHIKVRDKAGNIVEKDYVINSISTSSNKEFNYLKLIFILSFILLIGLVYFQIEKRKKFQ